MPEDVDSSHDFARAAEDRSSIPAMPKFVRDQLGQPLAFYGPYGDRHTIGALTRDEKKGGNSFVVVNQGNFRNKILHHFPVSDEGWAAAWGELVALDRAAGEKLRKALEQFAVRQQAASALAELDAGTVKYLRNVIYLGGYASGADLKGGNEYDLRFLEDRLGVYPSRAASVLVDVPYSDVEAIDVGGPGLVKSGGGVVGGGFGVVGAVEGMAIAAVLNALTTQVKIKTVLRIQASQCELFMLNSVVEPEALRIELSQPLGAIRTAQAAKASPGHGARDPGEESVVGELSKLAAMMADGLLTRAEFELLKAKLIAGA